MTGNVDINKERGAVAPLEPSLEGLVDLMPVGVALVDDSGAFHYLNRSFTENFGYTLDDIPCISEWFLRAYPDPVYRSAVISVFSKPLTEPQQNGAPREARVTCKDGTVRHVVFNRQQAGRYRLIILTDISERKRAENELVSLKAHLEQLVRERTTQLEKAVGNHEAFSYSVSHDLRSPLRHINSYLSLLLEDFGEGLPAEALHYIDRARSASVKMGKLIDALLELSRISQSELARQPVDLSAMARRIVRRLAEQDPARTAQVVIAEHVVVPGDPVLLHQVLVNLLENAWKYSAGRERPRLEFGEASAAAGQRCLFVRDNGVGFDMAYKDQLFAPFNRLHGREFEGNGVGLATVKRIIERHGGTVWAEAEVDAGASFYFLLPHQSQS
jgi:PAS domain S-box-containing protein